MESRIQTAATLADPLIIEDAGWVCLLRGLAAFGGVSTGEPSSDWTLNKTYLGFTFCVLELFFKRIHFLFNYACGGVCVWICAHVSYRQLCRETHLVLHKNRRLATEPKAQPLILYV